MAGYRVDIFGNALTSGKPGTPSAGVDTRAVALPELQTRARDSLAVLAVVMACIALGTWSLFRPLQLQDEALIVVYADEARAGRIPDTDFFTPYGPATFGVVAAAFALFGAAVEVERSVGLTYHVAIALGLFFFARQFGRRTAVGAASWPPWS